MDLGHAIQKHSEWRIKFRSAISKKEQMDAMSVSKDACCEFGKWLHGEAKSQFGELGSYQECISKHAVFHAEAGKVAAAINRKNYAEAEEMIGINTPYGAASTAVAAAILKLKKEAQL